MEQRSASVITTGAQTFKRHPGIKTSALPHLDKCDFTLAVIAVDIFDGHLSVVFNPALAAQDVVDAGRHFVPFVVVPKPAEITKDIFCIIIKLRSTTTWVSKRK